MRIIQLNRAKKELYKLIQHVIQDHEALTIQDNISNAKAILVGQEHWFSLNETFFQNKQA